MKNLTKDLHQIPNRPIKIMQFGEGNFLRAFVDDFIQNLNDQKLINAGVVVVQPMPFGRVDEMQKQDGLYTLFLEGLQDGKVIKGHRVIDVLNDFVNPYTQLDKFLEYAKKPELEIIFSNTTEAGIVYLEEKISPIQTPESFPGKLLLFLKTRFESNLAPLEIVPCELIDYNGDELKEVLVRLASYNEYSQDLIDWIKNENKFYNTLVDRIVPGYPVDQAKELQNELGYIDNSMVKGEIFHLWVIQGPNTLSEKLPFAKSGLNVHFVESIVPYKQRKVKILNGSHTAMVPIAYLDNIKAVKEAVNDELVGKFVKSFIYDEVVPTIDLPKADMIAFSESVIERYQNPFVHHLLMSIALNSIAKFKSRILPTIEDLNQKGKFASYSLFTLASLIRFYKGTDLDGNVIDIKDDQEFLELFKNAWSNKNYQDVASKVLTINFWESDLLKEQKIIDYVAKVLELIDTNGMKVALEHLFEGKI